MTRTADRLVSRQTMHGAEGDPLVDMARDLVPKFPVIVADNVATYVRDKSEEWVLEALPCLSPPWPFFWIEYHGSETQRRGVAVIDTTNFVHNMRTVMPEEVDEDASGEELVQAWVFKELAERVGKGGVDGDGPDFRHLTMEPGRSGATPLAMLGVAAHRDWLENTWPGLPERLDAAPTSEWNDIWAEVGVDKKDTAPKWTITLVLFIEDAKKVSSPMAWLALALDGNGRVLGNRWQIHPGSTLDTDALLVAMHPALQTLAFLHCRNTELDETVPPAKVSAKHQKHYGRPLLRYKSLRLVLPRKAGVALGAGGGIRPGMHIAAGHFAHYGDCCPVSPTCVRPHGFNQCSLCGGHEPHGLLFGKYQGIYWTPMHVRGSKDEGIVVTDFEAVVN